MDISLQLSNLSAHSLDTEFPGETLDPTDAAPALNLASKLRPLETDSGQSKRSTLVGPHGLVKNACHSGPSNHPSVGPAHKPQQDTLIFDVGTKTPKKRLDLVLGPFGSPEGGSHQSADGRRGGAPGYNHPLLPSQPEHRPGPSDQHDAFPFAQIKFAALQSKMDPPRPAGPEQGSPAGGRGEENQNLDSSSSTEQRGADALLSKVHTVRVKPPSRFFSSADPLRQKPSVRPLKSGLALPSSQEHLAERGPASARLSPEQQTHLPKPAHSPPKRPGAGPGRAGSLGSAVALRNPVQAAGKIKTASF